MPVESNFSDLGKAKVRATFQNGTVGGCECSKGEIRSTSSIKVLRNNKEVYDGECIGLQLGNTQANGLKRTAQGHFLKITFSFFFLENRV